MQIYEVSKIMIESKRLILREMTKEDEDDFYDIFSSDEVGKFVHKMSRNDVEKYFEKRKNLKQNPFSFAVVLKENGKMIGTCGVKFDEKSCSGRLSYVFDVDYWNRGYCTEACKEVIKYCFNFGKMHKIEADCLENNYASQKILHEKLHFDYKGQFSKSNDADQKELSFRLYELTKVEFYKKCDDY